jgi:hypothetical protein
MDTLFDASRDALLRECPWNFARRRVQLAATGTAPAFGSYSDTYDLPADCLYVQHTDDFEAYTIENNQILANPSDNLTNGVLNLAYIARVTDMTRADTLFVEALSYRLAMEACENITQSNTKKDYLTNLYMDIVIRAKRYNGQEDSSKDFVEDTWITIRG